MSRAPTKNGKMLKGKAITLQALTDPSDLRRLRLPEFLYTRHVKVVKGSNEITRGTIDFILNRMTPNDPYSDRRAPLTSKRCILYIYSTNTDIYSPFLSLQNAVCFIILTYLVPVLFTFYIQSVLKFKK